MLEAKAKDAGASALQKKGLQIFFFRRSQKKRSSNKFFRQSPKEDNKKGLRKFYAEFLAFFNKILTVQKIVLSSSRGQGNFRGLEASRPRPKTSKCVLEDVLGDSSSGNNILFNAAKLF